MKGGRMYLAGPITGRDFHERKAYFAHKAAQLRADGYEVVDPLALEDHPIKWEDALKRDIPLLVTCDAIYLLPGWRRSRGAWLEYTIAVSLNLHVLLDEEEEVWRTRAARDSTMSSRN